MSESLLPIVPFHTAITAYLTGVMYAILLSTPCGSRTLHSNIRSYIRLDPLHVEKFHFSCIYNVKFNFGI